MGVTGRRLSVAADKAAPDTDRPKTLKTVAHLWADADQPLDTGFADDRGSFQVQAFGRSGNMYLVWD